MLAAESTRRGVAPLSLVAIPPVFHANFSAKSGNIVRGARMWTKICDMSWGCRVLLLRAANGGHCDLGLQPLPGALGGIRALHVVFAGLVM